jgi:hypothetical protein
MADQIVRVQTLGNMDDHAVCWLKAEQCGVKLRKKPSANAARARVELRS